MNAKQILRQQLAKGELQSLLQTLKKLGERFQRSRLIDDASFQLGRLETLEKQVSRKSITTEDEQVERAQIRTVALYLINQLPDNWTQKELSPSLQDLPVTTKTSWKKYASALVAAIALLASVAQFSGYSLKNIFQGSTPTSQTVLPSSPAVDIKTAGKNSPIIIGEDVTMNYGIETTKRDSSTKN